MILYDGVSGIDWFYEGYKTVETMGGESDKRDLFEVPCVLEDNGAGKVYRHKRLSEVAQTYAVPFAGSPGYVFSCIQSAINGTYKAPGVAEAQATADKAKATANEAKEVASQAGTDPQLQALATMQVATMDLTEATSTDCAGFRDYWPEWKPDTEYKYQQPLRHKGLYYRASKALTSSKVYPPDTAGESEYYPIEVAPDGVIVYRECHGEYDMVRAGETRHYPDAEGPVYRAKVGTAYDPDTVPDNWELA